MIIRLLLALGLFLLGPHFAALADTRITFVNPGKRDEFFWPAVADTMQAAAEQFGFELEILYAERDAQSMIRLGLEVVERTSPPDILILVNEFQAAPRIVEAAAARDIKVLMLLNSFVGRQSKEMGAPGEKYRNWIGSLVPSNRGAGERMAESLISCMRQKPAIATSGKRHVLVLSGDSRTPASLERTAGMHAAFKAAGYIVIDRHYHTNWQEPDAHRLTQNYLNWAEGNAITPAGIWAANDALAIGAMKAVEERMLAPGKDVCIVGLNWSPEAVDLVQAGKLAATDGGHFLAGAWAMVMISDYLARPAAERQPIGNASFEMASINGGNIADFLAKLGNRDWRHIPFRAFTRGAGGYDFSLDRILDLMDD